MRVILAGSRVRESAVGGRNPREAVLLELAEQGGGPSRKNRWTATPHMESASRSPLLARPRRRASVRRRGRARRGEREADSMWGVAVDRFFRLGPPPFP